MAVSVNNINASCLSCEIGEVELVETAAKSLDINLVHSSVGFFHTVVSPVNGRYILYDLRSAIEGYMRHKGICYAEVSLVMVEDGNLTSMSSFDFEVVYCERNIPADILGQDLVNAQFLASQDYTIISRQAVATVCLCDFLWVHYIDLYIYYSIGDSSEVKELYLGEKYEGRVVSYELTHEDMVQKVQDWDVVNGVVKVRYVVLSYGDARFTAFFSDRTPTISVWYRNMFNCLQYIELDAMVKRKSVMERSDAMVQNSFVSYDQRMHEEYEVEMLPYNDRHAAMLAEMLASHEVVVSYNGHKGACVITSSECATSNEPGKLNVVKFKFRYQKVTPLYQLP